MISFTVKGCWVFHTHPPEDSSIGELQTRADRAGACAVTKSHRRMTSRAGSCKISVDIIERDDLREPLSEITKQLFKVAV